MRQLTYRSPSTAIRPLPPIHPMPAPPQPPLPARSTRPTASPPSPHSPEPLGARPAAPIKGRGVQWLVPHRFNALQREVVDDGWGDNPGDEPGDNWGDPAQAVHEEPAAPTTTVIEQNVRSILSSNTSPDIPFDLSVNPYRGCEHGCVYCFARPTHSYLNLSPGLDFETRIFAKVNAAQRLREAFASRAYEPQPLNIGAATDAYQPAERRLRITRSVIEVLSECQHPFSLVTKSSGVERDIDLIAPMAHKNLATIYVSVTTLDAHLARILEPRAAAPARRLQTIERLAAAGIPVGVSISPTIPFINEPELERILEAAAHAGASRAFTVVLRLPWEVNPIFQSWLQQHFPQRAERVMARVREMHGGRDYDARSGVRMRGDGVWAQLLQQRFQKACARWGLNRDRSAPDLSLFQAPRQEAKPRPPSQQGDLF